MFFLIRCLFWLSLVYAHLPAGVGGGVNAGALLDMASAHVGAFARSNGEAIARQGGAALATQIADDGAAWCQTHGEACADAVLAAMYAKTATPAPSDTLTPADRAGRWRGSRRG